MRITSRMSMLFACTFLLSALTASGGATVPGEDHAVDSDLKMNETALSSLEIRNKAETAFGGLPVCFIENRGQVGGKVSYYVQGLDKIIFFTPEDITIAFKQTVQSGADSWIAKLRFVGADPEVQPIGEEKQKTTFSYFKGQPKDWNTAIPTFGKVVYEDLWPGVDLVYSGTVDKLKYEFVVSPGADPKQIRLAYSGITDLRLTETGSLTMDFPGGSFEDEKPFAYQSCRGVKREVPMRYAVQEMTEPGVFSYGFELGAYDPQETLILDPALLVYCGYIGGTGTDIGYSIAVDDQGNAYITGSTSTTEFTFPVKVGPDLIFNGTFPFTPEDAFVAKINATGTALDYCGYIGGAFNDFGFGIAVDNQGSAYIVGRTDSTESTFPVKGMLDSTFNGASDAFIAKVAADGTALEYCGYVGGESYDTGRGIALDETGNAYICGYTQSDESTFPVRGGPDLVYKGAGLFAKDAFVAKVNASGTALDYCGFIGGDSDDEGRGIAVDDAGYAYVTGTTYSTETLFPVKIGPDLVWNGGYDAFVAKVETDGSDLVYCGYLGGSGQDYGNDLAVDADGCAYITGDTDSAENSFPILLGPDLVYNGAMDAFIAKVVPQGTGLAYCGYIGGEEEDHGNGIALDGEGCAHIAGWTGSTETTFPVVQGPDLSYNGSYQDTYIAKVKPQGTALDYCGYVGGEYWEEAHDVAVDSLGNAYISGITYSDSSSFPVLVGPDFGYLWAEAFVAKVHVKGLNGDTYTLSQRGGEINLTLFAGTEKAGRGYLILGSRSGTAPGIPLPGGALLPLNWDAFTNLVIAQLNSSRFQGFLGVLDGSGSGLAQLKAESGDVPPSWIGTRIYFAFVLDDPFEFVSNPIAVELVP